MVIAPPTSFFGDCNAPWHFAKECKQLNFGRVVHSELRIEVQATKTRDQSPFSLWQPK
jgi:hypothetical protein